MEERMERRLSRIPSGPSGSPARGPSMPDERACLKPLTSAPAAPPASARLLATPSMDAPPSGAPADAPADENLDPAGAPPPTGGGRLAGELDAAFFRDRTYRGQLEAFLNKQLTRTKDGATEQSRIAELCDIVKGGRRLARHTDGKLEALRPVLATADAELAAAQARADAAAAAPAGAAQDVETADAERTAAAAALAERDARLERAAAERAELLAQQMAARLEADRTAAAKDVEVAGLASERDAALEQRDAALADAAAAAARHEAELDELRSAAARSASTEETPSKLQAQCDELGASRAALQEESLQQKLQLKNLEFDLAHKDVAHKKDVEKLQARINDAEAEINRMKRELLSEREQVAGLTFSNKQVASAQQRAEEELERMRQRSAQELGQVQANKGELWQTLMQTRNEAAKEADALREQLAKVTERADAAESRRDVLESERALWTADTSLTSQRITVLDKEVAELQSKLLEERKHSSQLEDGAAAVAAQLATLHHQLHEAAGRCQASEARACEAEQALQDAQASHQAASSRCEALEQDLTAARTQHGDASQKLQRVKAAMTTALESRNELEKTLLQTQQELDDALTAAADVRKASSDAVDEREVAEARARRAEAGLEAAQAEGAALTERVIDLEGQMEALQGIAGCGNQGEAIGQMVQRVGRLETTLAEAERVRRRLHNELMEIRGNVRVYCRIRPCSGPTVAEPLAADALRIVVDSKPHDFYLDRVMGAATSQDDVYAAVCDVVQSALDGYQVCLFSYGQTGSGKTHTMNGNPAVPTERGIIPRAVHGILDTAQRLAPAGWAFHLEAMYIEIYNEGLRDLLAPPSSAPGARPGALDGNAIKHESSGHTQVLGATRVHIDSEACARDVVARAAAVRSTDATAMNATSSRSHSVFMLQIVGAHEATGTMLTGSLNLVDLAGCERLARSQAEGQRQKEACAINKSLSCLGDIFQALATKSPHIPYRNSKLTYLLQSCLGGDGKTLMFVNVNPEVASAYESLCALRFASKVNSVTTAARGGARRHVASAAEPAPSGPSSRRESIAPYPEPPQRSLSASSLGGSSGGPRPSLMPRLPAPRASVLPRPAAGALSGVAKRPAPGIPRGAQPAPGAAQAAARCLSMPAAKRQK